MRIGVYGYNVKLSYGTGPLAQAFGYVEEFNMKQLRIKKEPEIIYLPSLNTGEGNFSTFDVVALLFIWCWAVGEFCFTLGRIL